MTKNPGGNNGVLNSKQQKTRQSVTKNTEETKTYEDLVKTYITHNKGGKWETLKAPVEDSEGNALKCYQEEQCSLHLQIYSSNGLFPPPYSQDSAVGVVIGVGNIGRQLERFKVDRMNTYLSRDGGLTWF